MYQGRSKKAIWLLLPLLMLRGLLPAGSMLGVTADGLSIIVCDNGVAAGPQVAHVEHHHDKKGSGKHDHSICPFALSAAGAPEPSMPEIGDLGVSAAGQAYEDCNIIAGLSGPSRAQQSRAPPAFS